MNYLFLPLFSWLLQSVTFTTSSAYLPAVAPSSTFVSLYLTNGLPGSGIPQDIYFNGGFFCLSAIAFSAIGLLYPPKIKAGNTRSDLCDLLLPAVATCNNSHTPARLAAGRLVTDISAPCLVSSTNATLDPCYFKSHTPHQLHSSVEVSPIACLSEVEFSNNRSDIFMRYTNFYRLLKLRLTLFTQSTNSTEHSQSHPIFESGIGEFQHIPEMESFNGPYFVDPVHHSYILSMATIPRIVLESLSDNSITSVNKIYNFKITSIGASVRQGDFLELPNRYWPRASPVCQISKA